MQRIVGVRDSLMRITARNIGQLPRRKLGKLGVKRNSESAVYNYAQSSALPRSGSPAFRSLSHALERSPVLHFKLHFDASPRENGGNGGRDDGFTRIALRFDVLISPEPGIL